ncbi:hypothetical protein FJY68_09925 [candidate division WOR-3 bacterium]|uniref:Uncharacterized protein n=1 Tax=candidate division WOR-3 bacterium TaxID=2052148 RepID=A0A938BS07_UNCW3|nr:hypothetical protein [candidate division WOR-3 bacterium]
MLTACFGQWSDPVPLLGGSSSTAGQALSAGAGDTIWTTVVSTAPPRVLACWTTGDTWSLPTELALPDSNPVFHDPGMGRDASGRLWSAWYKDSDSAGVWTAFRDSAGWHAPVRAYSGSPVVGPMSFAGDVKGNWYLGFATLTPYSDFSYSSAVYTTWNGDSWRAPRYIARGMGSPIETNFHAPTLVARPDSGLWAAYDMSAFGDSFAMLSVVQHDTSRRCCSWDGSAPAVTADSAGRLWLLYSQMGGFWLQSALVVDTVEVDTRLVTDYASGRGLAATDLEGIVWSAWKIRTLNYVGVNYTTGGNWSQPEQVSTMNGAPCGIASDVNGRVYVLFRAPSGQLYSVYRTSRPGVQEQPHRTADGSRLPAIVRNILFLPSSLLSPPSSLFSLDGRKVMDLRPGANDVSRLSPGVYFVRSASGVVRDASGVVTRVIIAR